jgi:hypothetical protein
VAIFTSLRECAFIFASHCPDVPSRDLADAEFATDLLVQ